MVRAPAVAVAPAVVLGRFNSRRSGQGGTARSWSPARNSNHPACSTRGLTLCSTGHLAAARALPSFHSGPCAVCRKAPVNTNVRPHKKKFMRTLRFPQPSCVFAATSVALRCGLRLRPNSRAHAAHPARVSAGLSAAMALVSRLHQRSSARERAEVKHGVVCLQVHRARPNPVFNRTPCGSPRMAFISFWAKRGLPQGAGYRVR